MAARQIKATKKATPAGRNTPTRRAAGKPNAVPAARKTPAQKAAAKPKAAASAPKPASNHGVPKKQAIDMLTGFVADMGRALKKGSKIRIPNLGILQVRVRPARPARKGRNPATGEEIRIKASKASKKVAFRVAKALKEAI